MKVQFTFPGNYTVEDKYLEMEAVPREGEDIDFGDGNISDSYEVKQVSWYPNSPDIDVYVVLRS